MEGHRGGHAITEGLHSTGLVWNFRFWVAYVKPRSISIKARNWAYALNDRLLKVKVRS